MDILFDLATEKFTVDTSDAQPWGADLRIILDLRGQSLNLRGLSLRLTVTADGEQVFEQQLPPPGALYSQTSQGVIAAGRVMWLPDQQITIQAQGGRRPSVASRTISFTAPRPDRPYPSWGWADGRWQAPEPQPDDGDLYGWDEGAGEWVKAGDAFY